MNDLFEKLFGTTIEQLKPKHLTEEEWKTLFNLGYDPNHWDHWLDIGKVTKSDVQVRVDLEKRRIELDQELRKRWESKRPQAKKDDVVSTKNYGKVMIRNTDSFGIVGYSSTYGQLVQMSWDILAKEMEIK